VKARNFITFQHLPSYQLPTAVAPNICRKRRNSPELRAFYKPDWGTIIGSVLVSDHPDRILGYVCMEADLISKRNSNTPPLSVYLKKTQWLLFQNNWIATYLYQDAGWLIGAIYPSRMKTAFNQADRDYLTYEYSRTGVAAMNPKYFLHNNWDLGSAIGKICTNNFSFPELQLQANSEPAQPPSILRMSPRNARMCRWNGSKAQATLIPLTSRGRWRMPSIGLSIHPNRLLSKGA
jgi:hypothetical protein